MPAISSSRRRLLRTIQRAHSGGTAQPNPAPAAIRNLLSILCFSLAICCPALAEPDNISNISKDPPLVSIPIKIIDSIPTLELAINGQHETFLLDTGSSRSVVSLECARALGIRTRQSNIVYPGFGESDGEQVSITEVIKISYDRATLIHGKVFAIDLSELSNAMRVNVSGIIGYDYLRTFPAMIDLRSLRFSVYGRNALDPDAVSKLRSLTLDKPEELPLIEGAAGIVESAIYPAKILLDTGSERGLVLTKAFALKNHLTQSDGWESSSNLGIGGSSQILEGMHGFVKLANTQIPISDAVIALVSKGATESASYEAAIGMPVLLNSCLIFDLAHGKIYWF